ncbi:hypothetical protein L596_013820 [Steinernema carpocapsae]|nr:hypothetical protein L596_013820 [Steinernema carpocapsae]
MLLGFVLGQTSRDTNNSPQTLWTTTKPPNEGGSTTKRPCKPNEKLTYCNLCPKTCRDIKDKRRETRTIKHHDSSEEKCCDKTQCWDWPRCQCPPDGYSVNAEGKCVPDNKCHVCKKDRDCSDKDINGECERDCPRKKKCELGKPKCDKGECKREQKCVKDRKHGKSSEERGR